MRYLTVRVVGTACFVEPADKLPDVGRRLILPFDNIPDIPEKKHIPYVEFPIAGMDASSRSELGTTYQHPPGSGQIHYARYDLLHHIVRIENVVAGSVNVQDPFKYHVPKMTKVHPGLDPLPRDECFDPYPDDAVFSAFFDITGGTLCSGSLYEFVTAYERRSGTTTASFQTPKDVMLLLQIDSEDVTVTFKKRDLPDVHVVLGHEQDLITIGNQPLDDIYTTGSGDDVEHHFRLYYNLAKDGTVGNDPPLPKITADPINSCTVTNWP